MVIHLLNFVSLHRKGSFHRLVHSNTLDRENASVLFHYGKNPWDILYLMPVMIPVT